MFIALVGRRGGGEGGWQREKTERRGSDARQTSHRLTQKDDQETWSWGFFVLLVPFIFIQSLSSDAAQPEEFLISCSTYLVTSCYWSLTKPATGNTMSQETDYEHVTPDTCEALCQTCGEDSRAVLDLANLWATFYTINRFFMMIWQTQASPILGAFSKMKSWICSTTRWGRK